MTLFGFVGSSVERMEPIGYQCAVQSKEEEEEAEEGEEEEEESVGAATNTEKQPSSALSF